MQKMNAIKNIVIWSAIGGFIFAIALFGLCLQLPLANVIATASLIPLGGAVVGGLIGLTIFADEEEESH